MAALSFEALHRGWVYWIISAGEVVPVKIKAKFGAHGKKWIRLADGRDVGPETYTFYATEKEALEALSG